MWRDFWTKHKKIVFFCTQEFGSQGLLASCLDEIQENRFLPAAVNLLQHLFQPLRLPIKSVNPVLNASSTASSTNREFISKSRELAESVESVGLRRKSGVSRAVVELVASQDSVELV